MTVTHRKRHHQPEDISSVDEPGVLYHCDSCRADLTHSIRIKCADPVCEAGEGVDICPGCFCEGKEFQKHKRGHPYRVVELHSYPIFSEDWGADEELLLLEGISLQGLGNWQAIAEHVGTRTKEEVEEHYKSVYVDSPNWPLPVDRHFNVDPVEFQERKRRRISNMKANPPPAPKVAPTSAPGVHEIGGFLPGRLEFEHELDNEAEDLVKDLEFGVCLEWGGDQIPEDENDPDVRARARWEEEQKSKDVILPPTQQRPSNGNGLLNGLVNGYHSNTASPSRELQARSDADKSENGTVKDEEDDGAAELTQPPPIETPASLAFKLALIEMYNQRVDRRHESKAIIYDRGLLNYKQMQAADKKRPKDEKELVLRLRPFAKLQSAADFEAFTTDLLYESMLRKRIQELQHYRRMGLTTAADIEKFESDLVKRTQAKANLTRNDYYSSERLQLRAGSGRQSSVSDARRGDSDSRRSHERETTPKLSAPAVSGTGPPGRKMPAPLNLANSPSLHLLTPEEQTLCSQLRILPKPYLVIKETLVREYARRGGKLRRREARDLVKIDVNKTSRVWDFLVQAGFLKVGAADTGLTAGANTDPTRPSATPSLSASPSKDSQAPLVSPRPPPFTTVPLMSAATSSAPYAFSAPPPAAASASGSQT